MTRLYLRSIRFVFVFGDAGMIGQEHGWFAWVRRRSCAGTCVSSFDTEPVPSLSLPLSTSAGVPPGTLLPAVSSSGKTKRSKNTLMIRRLPARAVSFDVGFRMAHLTSYRLTTLPVNSTSDWPNHLISRPPGSSCRTPYPPRLTVS